MWTWPLETIPEQGKTGFRISEELCWKCFLIWGVGNEYKEGVSSEETEAGQTSKSYLLQDPEDMSGNGLARRESSISCKNWHLGQLIQDPCHTNKIHTYNRPVHSAHSSYFCSLLPWFLGRCFRPPALPVSRHSYPRLWVEFYWVDDQHPSSGSICQPWRSYHFPLILCWGFQVFSDF